MRRTDPLPNTKDPDPMARAHFLIPGFQYRITSGLEVDQIVTIVDNHPFPDDDPEGRQRKITVKYEDGTVDYILPRLLSDEPMGIDSPVIQGAAPQAIAQAVEAPAPVSTPAGTATVINPATGQAITVARQPVTPITDPMDPRLDHFRPSRTKVKRYINRMMMNGMSDVDFLLTFTSDDHRAENEGRPANVMLKGNTQAGKTILVEVLAIAWADKMGYPKPMPVFTLSGSSGVTDYDLFGQTVTYADPETGQDRLVNLPGVLALAAECGGILYLDEVNAMAERVTSSIHPLADSRHQFINRGKATVKGGIFMPEVVTAHQDLWLVGTYNDENYRGMGEMNEAFINRFRHIKWDYDTEVEDKLIGSPGVRLLGECIRTARRANSRGLRTPVGTAALMRLERDIAAFGVDLALEIFKGMFKHTEYDTVDAIITDRSINLMLEQEAAQRTLNEEESGDARDDLRGMLD
jgi:AAA domain (dynein-related subfamily)